MWNIEYYQSETGRCPVEEFIDSLEPQVVSLATAIAERIIHSQPIMNVERVESVVRDALAHMEENEQMVLRLNPQDLKILHSHNVSLHNEFQFMKKLEIIEDESITSGGCVAESSAMKVDARIEMQFQKILDALLE